MSNDTTTASPPSSAEVLDPATTDGLGLDLDVTHEADAAWLVIKIRLPRNKILGKLVEALSAQDRGFNRMGGDY